MEIVRRIVIVAILSIIFSLPLAWLALAGGEEYAMLMSGLLSWGALAFFKYKGSNKIRLDAIDILFSCIVLYRIANACSPMDIQILSKTISISGMWFLFRNLPKKDKVLSYLQWGFIISAIIQAVVAIMQWNGIVDSNHAFFSATGLFGNPGELGGYLALGLVSLSCCLLKQEKRSRARIFTMLVCTALMLWGIVLADSRTSWLAVGVVVSMHFVIKRTNPAKILLPCAVFNFDQYHGRDYRYSVNTDPWPTPPANRWRGRRRGVHYK